MIAPLAPYGLKGVAWYQGEANVSEAGEYARLLPALMADWRTQFRVADLPFLVVQLAAFGPLSAVPQDTPLSRLREVQRRVVQADPRAGLAVTIDVGDPYDIHPTNKLEVGRRLGLLARRIAYGEAVTASAPEPVSARRDGERVVVTFSRGGLVSYGAARPVGFELCDSSRRCHYVDAAVVGGKVLLEAGAGEASLVRYAWADSPMVNLFGGEKLPVSPFELPVR
jgi:sialate O-acetylesterase